MNDETKNLAPLMEQTAAPGGPVCRGTNCAAIRGVGHSQECVAEHDQLIARAAMADHVAHGGWKCFFCGFDGQDNTRNNRFCSGCHLHV